MNNKIIFLIACATFWAACSESGTDAKPFDASAVCPENARGTFVDDRDGQVYKYTTIGDQVWMAQNLNYASEYSTTNDSLKDCAECGLWYAIGLSLPDRSFIDTICPVGWKIPNVEDWEKLISTVGGNANAVKVLLSEDWDSLYQGTNECAFNGIKAGYVFRISSKFGKGIAAWASQYVTRPHFIKAVQFYGDRRTPVVEINELSWNEYISIRCIKD